MVVKILDDKETNELSSIAPTSKINGTNGISNGKVGIVEEKVKTEDSLEKFERLKEKITRQNDRMKNVLDSLNKFDETIFPVVNIHHRESTQQELKLVEVLEKIERPLLSSVQILEKLEEVNKIL